MREIFADTNIFIRFFLNDNPRFSKLARDIISNCISGQYSLVVHQAIFLEITWLLLSFYKLPKNKVINNLESILKLKNLKCLDREIVEIAITIYKAKSVDLVDAYTAANMIYRKAHEIFSFDHDFDKIPTIKRL